MSFLITSGTRQEQTSLYSNPSSLEGSDIPLLDPGRSEAAGRRGGCWNEIADGKRLRMEGHNTAELWSWENLTREYWLESD